MKSAIRFLLSASAVATLAFVVSGAVRAGDVKEADPTCRTATAILLTGDASSEADNMNRIREVVRGHSDWKVVDAPPEGRVGDVALVAFDVKHTYKGGPTAAFTVQCGHGGTCNDVALKFRERYPSLSPTPVVQCGDITNMLVNPRVVR
jgi:hypothetical protein